MSDEHHCKGAGAGGEGHQHGITCREISEFLLAYLERELEPQARTEFDRHLNHCPPCGHYLDGYRETVELVRRCVRGDAGSATGSDAGAQTCPTELTPEQRAKAKPPEGLVQAILAAKRSLAR